VQCAGVNIWKRGIDSTRELRKPRICTRGYTSAIKIQPHRRGDVEAVEMKEPVISRTNVALTAYNCRPRFW